MELLVPCTKEVSNWNEELAVFKAKLPLKPFDKVIQQFVQEISNKILLDISFRKYPELVAMAHWMRKAHISALEKEFNDKKASKIWLPRGVALHFAPSNVDSIFIYSWFISLLVGNLNIIRLSRNRGEQISRLLDVVNQVIELDEFKLIRERTLVLTYEHSDEVTRLLSSYCSIRVIWGGDETIKKIRSIPLSPNATEIVFADKFSFACINAKVFNEETSENVKKLAINFYNDAYWFDQMACSSPRLIAWVGNQEQVDSAKKRFWENVEQVLNEKKYKTEPSVGITRMTTGYAYAIQGFTDKLSTSGTDQPYRVHLDFNAIDGGMIREQHCGGGLFLETEINELQELASFIQNKDQTLSVFGFEHKELEIFAHELASVGIDRIVPIGQALTFNNVWDGYDLVSYFTKELLIIK